MTPRARHHRFTAHIKDSGPSVRQWVADADSFIDAAVRFAESADADGEVSVVVTDCQSGKDRCFLVNLDTGAVSGC